MVSRGEITFAGLDFLSGTPCNSGIPDTGGPRPAPVSCGGLSFLICRVGLPSQTVEGKEGERLSLSPGPGASSPPVTCLRAESPWEMG